jgi:hypothetical protein
MEFDLGRPWSINGPHTWAHSGGNIDREIGDEHIVTVKDEAI